MIERHCTPVFSARRVLPENLEHGLHSAHDASHISTFLLPSVQAPAMYHVVPFAMRGLHGTFGARAAICREMIQADWTLLILECQVHGLTEGLVEKVVQLSQVLADELVFLCDL